MLDLAQSFEVKSKQQASATAQALQSDYRRLRELSTKESKQSAATIESDFRALSQRLQGLMLRSWLWMALTVVAIGLIGYGALWWTGQQIAENLDTIHNQEQTIERLKQQGGALKWSRCNGRPCIKIDPKAGQYEGNYMIPEGY